MKNIICIQIVSLIYIFMISIIFFKKEKVNIVSNKIFGSLIIGNLLGLILDILCTFIAVKVQKISFLVVLLSKLLLCYLIIWIIVITIYVYVISKNVKNEENANLWNKYLKFKKIILSIAFAICVLILLLPLKIVIEKNYAYATSTNTSCLILYITSFLLIFVWMILLLKNKKQIFEKKYYPIYAYIILGTLAAIVQFLNPSLTIIVPVESIITILIYFTMENPDVKLVEYEKQEREKIIAAAESKSEFLSSTSHELRTPLNAIIGLSEDIQSFKNMDPAIIDDTRDLINASNSLLDIISNILDSSKIESGKLDIVECDYLAKDEYESLINIYRVKAFRKNLQWNSEISDEIPKVLYGDKQRIKQIIANLIDNAIKFTDSGKINIKLEWDQLNKSLIIKVNDTGRGIPNDITSNFLADKEELKIDKVYSATGTGLGLTICKNLIKLLHGHVYVDSTPLVGTKYLVIIPQELGDYKVIEEQEKVDKLEIDKLDYTGKRLLVVDDNPINIKVLKKAIQSFNCEIDECGNGKDAIEKIELNNNYDLVFMDIMMPIMGGEEAIKLLREKPNFHTPVVALTADAVSGATEKYRKMGFDDYLAKPFSRETVAKKLYSVLDSEANK